MASRCGAPFWQEHIGIYHADQCAELEYFSKAEQNFLHERDVKLYYNFFPRASLCVNFNTQAATETPARHPTSAELALYLTGQG